MLHNVDIDIREEAGLQSQWHQRRKKAGRLYSSGDMVAANVKMVVWSHIEWRGLKLHEDGDMGWGSVVVAGQAANF